MRKAFKTMTLTASALALGFAITASSGALANVQEEREELMKGIVGVMKKLAPVFKGEAAFEGEMVAMNGAMAAENFMKAKELFPEGSTEGRALPVIWEQNDKFHGFFEDAISGAKAVEAAGAAGDEAAFKEAFMQMGGSCKSCHETFRKPE